MVKKLAETLKKEFLNLSRQQIRQVIALITDQPKECVPTVLGRERINHRGSHDKEVSVADKHNGIP